MKSMEDYDTIDYYDRFAEQYFNNTVNADMSENCDRFIKYVRPGGRIIDIGAGSGRDILYFKQRGFQVEGIDASAELCKLAFQYTGTEVKCLKIQDWYPDNVYDGIWVNASLSHLSIGEIEKFILRTGTYLSEYGAVYISLKSGINTGKNAEGRYFTNVNDQDVQQIIEKCTTNELIECWTTQDKLQRNEIKWINVILRKV